VSDLSNGYDDESESFIASRSPTIGVSIVRSWARSLPAGARALEIGCGDGNPITRTLIEEGLNVYAVDASPKMAAAFRRNFPGIPVTCQAAEHLHELDRKSWTDIRTGRTSVSLGAAKCQSLLLSANLLLIAEYDDEGSNHYYEAEKR